jgi:hypothetical protein
MRATNDTPIDPEIAAELDAIDATLAGEPVDPKYADVAELALLLVAERPAPRQEFLDSLDARAARRFAAAPGAAAGTPAGGWWRRIQSWGTMPALGTAAAGLAVAGVAVVVLASGGGHRHRVVEALNLSPALTGSSTTSSGARASHSAPRLAASGGASTSASSAATPKAPFGSLKRAPAPPNRTLSPSPTATTPANVAGGSAEAATSASPVTPKVPAPGTPTNGAAAGSGASAQSLAAAPTPQPNGRKIVQSAQLALTTRPDHIDQVSQEVFNVVGNNNGIVERSSVTSSGSPDSYAQFQLSIPSGNLAQAMKDLSKLQYAHVASRSDSTQDINHAFVSTRSTLAEQQALRTSLLKQLAAAYTQQAIDAIKARLHGVDLRIAALEARIKNLNHRVAYSQVQVTLNASRAPVPVHHGHNSGFTIGKALHDAGRVLTVAGGVAVITLAALVPVGLLGGLAAWLGIGIRRRRREHALDLA